jgi:predicted DNA-binding transcriptional regulator AlpA
MSRSQLKFHLGLQSNSKLFAGLQMSINERRYLMSMSKKFTGGNFLKLREILALLRISRSTWYDGVKRKEFPQPVRIGTRSVVWLESDIDDYLRRNYDGPV